MGMYIGWSPRMRLLRIHRDPGAGVPLRLVELRDERRQVQQRRREDDRDDAGHVDLDRDVGARAAVHAAADHPLGVLHGDAALGLLDEDDGRHDDEADTITTSEDVPGPSAAGWRHSELGKLSRDRGEDQQRHAVADAALGDELTHPHDQAGARGHREHHDERCRSRCRSGMMVVQAQPGRTAARGCGRP